MRGHKRVSLSRTLQYAERKGLTLERFNNSHAKWLFGGYRKGAFNEHDVPEGMEPAEFKQFLNKVLSSYSHALVHVDANSKVLALVLITEITHILEARTYHMPWSSKASRLAGAVMYFGGLSPNWLGVKYCGPAELEYCNHLARYGVIKKGGVIEGFYRNPGSGEEADAAIFHTVNVKTPWLKAEKQKMKLLLRPES